MQPTYLPWLGYFDLIKSADVFVFLDHVQFSKQSWQQRNNILSKNGKLMLTIPVIKDSAKNKPINNVDIDNSRKLHIKHLKSIRDNYSKSKNFDIIYKELEEIYLKNNGKLMSLNIDLIKYGCFKMGIKFDFIFSSDLEINNHKVKGIIEICEKLNANQYLSPIGAKEYIDENNIFKKNNIELIYHKFDHPIYNQHNSENFISHVSFIDYLFNK
jgi:hypothetical protein